MPRVSQNDFKAKSEELFEETKEEASRLKDAVLMKQINELIEEARTLLKANKADEAQLKWEQAGERIAEVRISIGQEPLANRLLRTELGYLIGLLLIAYLTYQVPHFFLWDGLINLHTQTVWQVPLEELPSRSTVSIRISKKEISTPSTNCGIYASRSLAVYSAGSFSLFITSA